MSRCIASAPTVTGSVFMRRFRLSLRHWCFMCFFNVWKRETFFRSQNCDEKCKFNIARKSNLAKLVQLIFLLCSSRLLGCQDNVPFFFKGKRQPKVKYCPLVIGPACPEYKKRKFLPKHRSRLSDTWVDTTIQEGFIQKRRQRSSLLSGVQYFTSNRMN